MKMQKIPVSELEGAHLDWAVATIEKLPEAKIHNIMGIQICFAKWCTGKFPVGAYSPTNNWGIAGPIIERELIWISAPYLNCGHWCASVDKNGYYLYGRTPLIASMRAFVASKLGDVVEVPA